jgi:hypothetical protein
MYKVIGAILVFFTLVLVLYGCGLNEATIQSDQKSFLYFSGNIENSFVSIDHGDKIELGKTRIEPKNEKNMKTTKRFKKEYYETTPGKHSIIVTRNGKIIVNRLVILGDGIVKEVSIP